MKGCGRFHIRFSIIDKNNRVYPGGVYIVFLCKSKARFFLQSRKHEAIIVIVFDHKLYGTIAQITHAVE